VQLWHQYWHHYEVFGKQDGTAIDLSAIAAGIGGFLINSETMSDDRGSFGPSVSCAGDVNGDGLDDLILGAYTADPNGKLDAIILRSMALLSALPNTT
jgi:hypothetical protein